MGEGENEGSFNPSHVYPDVSIPKIIILGIDNHEAVDNLCVYLEILQFACAT